MGRRLWQRLSAVCFLVYFLVCFLVLGMAPSSEALAAQTPKVHRDSDGMPRCLEHPKRFYEGVLLVWNDRKQYEREIFTVPLSKLDISPAKRHCGSWPGLVEKYRSLLDTGHVTKLDPEATQAHGFALDEFVLRALKQVRRGGNVYRTEATVEEFVAKHKIRFFDRSLNWRLTNDYGPGWTGTVFKHLRDQRPRNIELKQDLLAFLAGERTVPSLNERYAGITMVFAKGYMEDPKTSRVAALINVLNSAGVRVEDFAMESTDSVVENSRLVERELRQRLARGERLVLVGVSKGAPEILSALARMRLDVDRSSNGVGRYPGRIEAVVSISGTIGGSFLVDWSLAFPQWLYIENMIMKEARDTGVPMKEVRPGFEQQGAKFLSRYMSEHGPRLPKEPVYFEVSGVLVGKGIAPKDTFLNQLQKNQLDTWFFPRHAANDGFIEYPGTEIPEGWVPKLWQMTFSSSHSLLDGRYENHPMWEDATRDRVIEGIFQSLADRIDRNRILTTR